MATDDNTPAPGWYPDPSGQTTQRWWDGEQWTDWTDDNHPSAGQADPHAARDRPDRRAGRVIVIVLAVVAGLAIAGIAGLALLGGLCVSMMHGAG